MPDIPAVVQGIFTIPHRMLLSRSVSGLLRFCSRHLVPLFCLAVTPLFGTVVSVFGTISKCEMQDKRP